MFVTFDDFNKIMISNNITINGVFHIGAHNCEELSFYNRLGLANDDVVWIDAMKTKVDEAQNRGIPNVYHGVITDKDDEEVVFNVSNNGESSSVLDFNTHSQSYPHIVFVDKIIQQSITVDTFFERNNLDASKYNCWNFDIQGAEFMALKGAVKSIQHAKVIYLEVNETEVYKNCGLLTEIDHFLEQYKFKRVITCMTGEGWGDALYILSNE